MFHDYTARILEDYHSKRAANTLSPRLARPTTAKLREECIAVFVGRFTRKDDNTLRIFFGLTGAPDTYLQAISKSDPDKFRPIINFLKGEVARPDEKNVELVAWLINFEPRPFEIGRSYEQENTRPLKKQTEIPMQKGVVDDKGASYKGGSLATSGKEETENKMMSRQEGKIKSKRKWMIITAVCVVMLGITGIVWIGSTLLQSGPNSRDGCMYWTGVHYKQVSCNTKIHGALVIALDSNLLTHFQRITREDTITQNAIGYVWYYKEGDTYEYYTAPGRHPVHVEDSLKRITAYIITHHLASPVK